MFDTRTYENLIQEMLDNVENDVDKREGSIIYDALAPCALKLAEMYYELNNFIDLVFSDTACGEYLDRKVQDSGLTRKQPIQAVRKITTNGPIDIDTRWGISNLIYTVKEKVSETEYNALCETYGEIGNTYYGELQNIDNVNAIEAVLSDIVRSGEDEESDENLRERFYYKVQIPSTSGNVSDYIKWALEVSGVGNAKVYPLWNGPGTVKVLVVDSENKIDSTLENTVYEYIESVRPIGATVTVDSPSETRINIQASIELVGSRSLEEVKEMCIKNIETYINSCVFTVNSISISRIGSIILTTEGVQDYQNLLLNGVPHNITIEDEYVPTIGSVAFTEV